MNTDKAYILGLIIGGGIWGNAEDVFRIRLPYRQWGSYEQNPQRAGQISRDIMSVVSPMFRSVYNISVSFEATNSQWNILCEGDMTDLKSDLSSYGISCDGELRETSDLKGIVAVLVDDNLKRRFIAGLADTIGSTAKSHRRFSDEIQILSFEVKGFNFAFVCDLCRLLYSVNCYPDQILWNHPNFHSASNPYYKQWKKGFKLRIQLDQYAKFGAFAFRTKAESSQANRSLQQEEHDAIPCPERELSVKTSCVHLAENDKCLPECIRGGHYLHNRHVCAVLGCEHAPYDKVSELFTRTGNLVNPFPILYKDELSFVEDRINKTDIFKNRTYTDTQYSVADLINKFEENNRQLLFGNKQDIGYPISEIMQAVAYIIADENELNGKRPKGNFLTLIRQHLNTTPNLFVEFRIPELLTPIVICGNNRGALVGAINPDVYQKLVQFDKDNKYKFSLRPITEEDLQNG
ncbi:MAG: hypothetical protein VB095_00705 [Anaerovorax sp.]|nr:hypothetical protein [Anaerovorax sp.]